MSTMIFSEAERKRSFQLNMLIGGVGAVFLTAFGSNALLSQHYPLAANLLAMALCGLISLVAMQRSGNPRYGAYGVSLVAAYACVYLVATGGTDGTGPLWCYPLVVIIMFLMGLRLGTAVALGLIALLSALLFVPDFPLAAVDYPYSFKVRFVSSFLALTIMSVIYEYLRSKSQDGFQRISAKLHAASRTDELTGVANRRAMQQSLETEFARFSRHGGVFSILMADVDYFKLVNDRYGHAVGDDLLIEIARLFSTDLRAEDCAARWGGEEFLILLPHTPCEKAREVAEKLRERVANIDLSKLGMRERTTVSFGVHCIDRAKDIDDLIEQADQLLYRAKHLGRNRVECSEPGPASARARAASSPPARA